MSEELKCLCNHCSQPIAFPAKMLGQTIPCPACQMDTVLYGKAKEAQATPSAPQIKSEPRPPRAWNYFGFLTFIATATTAIFVFLIWHQQQLPAAPAIKWQYHSFAYDGENSIADLAGQRFYLSIVFNDEQFVTNAAGEFIGFTNIETRPYPVFSAEAILNEIGDDGWELAWVAGQNYIVKRPSAIWKHEGFVLLYRPLTN